MSRLPCSLALAALLSTAVLADAQAPVANQTLADREARRFPQPVRVGDLIGRQVLQPVPAQHVLGRVISIARTGTGGIEVVIRYGGFLGFGARPIAVPVEAIALLGEYLAILDFTPDELSRFPSAPEQGQGSLAPEQVISIGLTKPFH